MTVDQQLLNADVQEEFAKICSDRENVQTWLRYIRHRINKEYIRRYVPEATPEEIFGELTIKIYYDHILWNRKVYPCFINFMFGRLQNIIRGTEQKAERLTKRKNRQGLRKSRQIRYNASGEKEICKDDEDLSDLVTGYEVEIEEEKAGANYDSGESENGNDADTAGDEAEVDAKDYNKCSIDESENKERKGEKTECDLYPYNVGVKEGNQFFEPSITLNIDLIDKKLPEESDEYIKYEDSFTAQFNRGEFGNIVEMIFVDPEDTELLALYVGKCVEEKRREEIMKEYGWTEKR